MRHVIQSALALLLLSAPVTVAGGDPPSEPEPTTATFSMYCYWTGEATLGRVDGVLASRIGHWGGSEIVQVDYDPAQTGLAELVDTLKRQGSFYSVVVAGDDEKLEAARSVADNDLARRRGRPHFIEPKHSLRQRHPELLALDLTERQAILLNSWSYFGGTMPDVLTPEQKRRLASH